MIDLQKTKKFSPQRRKGRKEGKQILVKKPLRSLRLCGEQ
jgi:hypothetical protein